MNPLNKNHGSAGPPKPCAQGLKCAQRPSRIAAMAIRPRFATAPPTNRAERAAQIEEQLQSSVVRIAASIRTASLRPVHDLCASYALHGLTTRVRRSTPLSMAEESAKKAVPNQPIGALVKKTAREVRKQPVKSVLWAFFIGILLTVFPIGRVVGALTSLVFALLRPALLLLGIVKFCEKTGCRKQSSETKSPAE